MTNIPDHPGVSMAQRTGYGERYEEPQLVCPCCGEILEPGDTVFTQDGEVIGCEFCVSKSTAEEELA